MTEAEWLECTDPLKMLELLKGKASDRKFRLFACACCRHLSPALMNKRFRKVIDVSELYADGQMPEREFDRAGHSAWQAACKAPRQWDMPGKEDLWRWTWEAVRQAIGDNRSLPHGARYVVGAVFEAAFWAGIEEPQFRPATLLRCFFGNPFRTITSVHTWRDGTIPKLAQAAYDERELPSGHLDPTLLAVLADALEEAGCTDAEVLGHLRGPGPHVRGCWVVDLVLGKE